MKACILIVVMLTLLGSNNEISGQKSSRVKPQKKIYACLPDIVNNKISKSQMLSVSEIRLTENQDTIFQIISFKLIIISKGRDPYELSSNSNRLTNKMKKELGKLRLGEKVYFEKIKCIDKRKYEHNVEPIGVTIIKID